MNHGSAMHEVGAMNDASAEAEGHAFVTGATGLIGRWLVPALTRRGFTVTALVRDADGRAAEYLAWVAAHGGVAARVHVVNGDLAEDDLGLDAEARSLLADASIVYHLGATMQLGLDAATATRVNEGGAERLLRMAGASARKPRFVLISGFRMGASKERDLARAGAYEASKVRADRTTRALASEHGLPLTIVNPAVVIGDSRTGETTLFWGFGDIVRDLKGRKLPAVPGSRDHWMPLVTVDYLAEFLTRVPPHDAAPLAEYFVLDERTPNLGAMMVLVAERLGVAAPCFHVPMALVPLFLRLTGKADKIEGLTFISTDRYDTSSATQAAAEVGLTMPDLASAIARNVDFLIAHDFGAS